MKKNEVDFKPTLVSHRVVESGGGARKLEVTTVYVRGKETKLKKKLFTTFKNQKNGAAR